MARGGFVRQAGINAGGRPTVVLIEPTAHRIDGHGLENLVRLAGAGPEIRIVVITPYGIHPSAAHFFASPGVEVLARDHWSPGARMYHWLAQALRRTFKAVKRLWPRARWPRQGAHFERCLVEVACLRVARRITRRQENCVSVVLSASSVLPRTAALLSRTWHIRYVHEFTSFDTAWCSWLDNRLRRFGPSPLVLCPTAGVAEQVTSRLRDPRVRIQTSTVLSDGDERLEFDSSLRQELALPDSVPLLGLFGGWWNYKDNPTIVTAVTRATRDLSLVVSGTPVPDEAVMELRSRLGPRLHYIEGALTLPEYRRTWAGIDAVIIGRMPGTDKESAQLIDAIRFGRRVIMADCDTHLRNALGDRPWIRWFRAGDAESLAEALEGFDRGGAPGPERDEGSAIGVLTAGAALRRFLEFAMEPR